MSTMRASEVRVLTVGELAEIMQIFLFGNCGVNNRQEAYYVGYADGGKAFANALLKKFMIDQPDVADALVKQAWDLTQRAFAKQAEAAKEAAKKKEEDK